MKQIVKIFIFCVAVLVISPSVNADNCVRVIKNNSNQPWVFRFSAFHGNVYFISGVSCPVNGPCTIPPHTTVNIEYTHTGGWENGRVYIDDHARWGDKFTYTNSVIGVICPYIRHYGATGGVSLNEPDDGSFLIEKDTWKG